MTGGGFDEIYFNRKIGRLESERLGQREGGMGEEKCSMEGDGGEEASEEKRDFGARAKGEGHGLFFRFVNEVELNDADLAGAIHELDKKTIIHCLIPAKVHFGRGLAAGEGPEFFLKKGQRDGEAL